MKKGGILNGELMKWLTMARHTHLITICDAGFPVPSGANLVDISLTAGIPSFFQTLKAILNELVVEEYTVFTFLDQVNPETGEELRRILPQQKRTELSFEEFVERSKAAILFVRTGELLPASNVILSSASGVSAVCDSLDIYFDKI